MMSGPSLELPRQVALGAIGVLVVLTFAATLSVASLTGRLTAPRTVSGPARAGQQLTLTGAGSAAKAVAPVLSEVCVDALCENPGPVAWHVSSLSSGEICYAPPDDDRVAECLGSYVAAPATSAQAVLSDRLTRDASSLGATTCFKQTRVDLNGFAGQMADDCFNVKSGNSSYEVERRYLFSTDTYGATVYYMTYQAPDANRGEVFDRYVKDDAWLAVFNGATFSIR